MDKGRVIAELRLSLAFVLLCASAQAETRVIDGDGLEVNGVTIRRLAIDSPERGEAGADEAAAYLRRLAEGKRPTCQRIDVDRYDREVSLCSADSVDLSLSQLRAGHAVVWCYYVRRNRPAMLATFQAAEVEAKRERRGIWARPFMPWREWGS